MHCHFSPQYLHRVLTDKQRFKLRCVCLHEGRQRIRSLDAERLRSSISASRVANVINGLWLGVSAAWLIMNSAY